MGFNKKFKCTEIIRNHLFLLQTKLHTWILMVFIPFVKTHVTHVLFVLHKNHSFQYFSVLLDTKTPLFSTETPLFTIETDQISYTFLTKLYFPISFLLHLFWLTYIFQPPSFYYFSTFLLYFPNTFRMEYTSFDSL